MNSRNYLIFLIWFCYMKSIGRKRLPMKVSDMTGKTLTEVLFSLLDGKVKFSDKKKLRNYFETVFNTSINA